MKTVLILFFCSASFAHLGGNDLGRWCDHVGMSTFTHVTPSVTVLVLAAPERSVSEADLADKGEPRLCPDHPGLTHTEGAEALSCPHPLQGFFGAPDRSPILRC